MAFSDRLFSPAEQTGVSTDFTPRAQRAVALARQEADRLHVNFLGTEHLLLGIIKLDQECRRMNVLRKMGQDLSVLWTEIEKQTLIGPGEKMTGNIPYTPRVKKTVFALAQNVKP